jgi:hypothetical protein
MTGFNPLRIATMASARIAFAAAEGDSAGSAADGGAGAGGGGDTPPPAQPDGGAGGQQGNKTNGAAGDGGGAGEENPYAWFGDQVDTDTQKYLEAKSFKSPADLYKSLRAAEKMIRGDQLPGPPDDPEKQPEWLKSSGLAKRLGIPDDPGEYKIDPPEFPEEIRGMVSYDDTRHTKLLEQAHKLNMTPAQVEGMLGFYRDELAADAQTFTTEAQTDEARMKAELGREWGEDYDTNLRAALEVAKETGLEADQIEALRVGKVAGSTALTKILHELAVARGNDTLKGGGKGGGMMTRQTAQAELDAFTAKHADALTKHDHPEHEWAFNKMQELKRAAGRGVAGLG